MKFVEMTAAKEKERERKVENVLATLDQRRTTYGGGGGAGSVYAPSRPGTAGARSTVGGTANRQALNDGGFMGRQIDDIERRRRWGAYGNRGLALGGDTVIWRDVLKQVGMLVWGWEAPYIPKSQKILHCETFDARPLEVRPRTAAYTDVP